MPREDDGLTTRSTPIPLGRLHRSSRRVTVRVLDSGREIDRFEATSPETLRAALRPIYRHLPRESGAIEFTAVEEEWLPLSVRRLHREIERVNLNEALEFLAA